MKIGVSAFAWTKSFSQSHLGLIPAIAEQGFDGFEIPMFDPANLRPVEIRRAFECAHMECTVCAILPPGINPISPDASIRQKSLAHLHHCVETAAELGARLICGPMFAPIGYLPGRRRSADEWNWAVETFQALGDALESHNITLSIEPVNRSETFFLMTGADAKKFCAAINHPSIGVTLDTFHANIEEKRIAQTVLVLGKMLKHLHASENYRGLLGSGHVDFPGLVAALRQIDYDGYLVIEGFGFSAQEPDSLGGLWGDPNVSPKDIAFMGRTYLQHLLASE
jgi:D-psicose/D-tagatose/L-ribulose 3-epimerase